MKHCNSCGFDKDDALFNYKDKSKNTRRSICSDCSRAYGRFHYENHRDQYAERNRKNKNKVRGKYREYKEHLSCSICGEFEPCCLDFHHTDPKEKEGNVPNLVDWKRSWERVEEEIEKCVVLCSNCHRKVHAGLLELPL